MDVVKHKRPLLPIVLMSTDASADRALLDASFAKYPPGSLMRFFDAYAERAHHFVTQILAQ